MRVWVKPPGWQPADVAQRFLARIQAMDTVKRYDPVLTPVQQWTAIGQLVLWLRAILVFLWHAKASSFGINAPMLGLTIAGLWITGAVLEFAVRLR